jgi:hypothetical protein
VYLDSAAKRASLLPVRATVASAIDCVGDVERDNQQPTNATAITKRSTSCDTIGSRVNEQTMRGHACVRIAVRTIHALLLLSHSPFPLATGLPI